MVSLACFSEGRTRNYKFVVVVVVVVTVNTYLHIYLHTWAPGSIRGHLTLAGFLQLVALILQLLLQNRPAAVKFISFLQPIFCYHLYFFYSSQINEQLKPFFLVIIFLQSYVIAEKKLIDSTHVNWCETNTLKKNFNTSLKRGIIHIIINFLNTLEMVPWVVVTIWWVRVINSRGKKNYTINLTCL